MVRQGPAWSGLARRGRPGGVRRDMARQGKKEDKMYQIKVAIEGIAPILFNRYTQANVVEVREGRSTARKTDGARQQEAQENKIYRNKDGLFCPAENIERAMVSACSISDLKYSGKKNLGSILKAVVFIEPTEVSFGVDQPDYIDERPGRIPPGPRGARVIIYRPALKPGWKLSFMIDVFDDRIAIEKIRRVLDDAGIYIGICDGRPKFGRFMVSVFEKMGK